MPRSVYYRTSFAVNAWYKKKMYFLALFTLLVVGSSQAIKFGKCPHLPTVKNFDPREYVGTWYEVESYGNLFERIETKCPKATYTSEGGDHILVKNQGISTWSGKPFEVNAIAVADGDISNGKLNVVFKGPLGFNFTAPYWVLGTDYYNYSVVWSCVQFLEFYIDASYIMTRDRTVPLPDSLSAAVDGLLEKVNISRARYVKDKQANCTN